MSTVHSIELEERVGQIADEFVSRLQRGEDPTIEEYVATHPDLTDVLRKVLPLVKASQSRAAVSAPPMPGRLGEFLIVREIGRGGMAVVYESVQEPLGRRVALKVLRAVVPLHACSLERFRREAQAAARLHHTHIVPVFGTGTADGFHYIAMQLIEGESLAVANVPDRQKVARIGLQAAEALAHAHAHGVLHRDVKPSNLLLDRAGDVWVTDFGLAKLADGDELTASRDFLGTLRYASPERLNGVADERSDVYGLGITMYELLAGRPAFAAEGRDQLVRQIAEHEPPRPSRFISNLPRDLETVVLKAMAKEPAHRYASAGELAEDLRRFLDGRPVTARRLSPIGHLSRWAKRNPALATAIGLAAVSLLTGLASTSWLWKRAEDHLQVAVTQSQRAQDNFRWANEAVDELLTDVGTGFQSVPAMQPVRKQLLLKALALHERFLEAHGENPAQSFEAGRVARRVGELHRMLGAHEAAERAFVQATTLLERAAAAEPDRIENQLELASVASNWGVLFKQMGRRADAERLYRVAHQRCEDLVQRHPANSEVRHELGISLHNLGTHLMETKQTNEAESMLRRAIAEQQHAVHAVPANPKYRRDLARHFFNLSNWLELRNQLSEAEAELGRAIAIWEQLVAEDPVKAAHRQDLALGLNSLGLFAVAAKRPDAEPAFRRAIDLQRQLVQDFPAIPDYASDLGGTLHNLADLLEERDPAAARPLVEEAVSRQLAAIRSAPQKLGYRHYLGNHYILLSSIEVLSGNHAAAAAVARKLPGVLTTSADFAWYAARRLAQCAQMAENDGQLDSEKRTRLAQTYRNEAIEMIRTAVQRGYRNVAALKSTAELASLQSMPAFQQIVAGLESVRK
jgi:serine/threonine protein kinase